MTARWWAPTKPGIVPDPLDLALLQPGGDDRYDLGAAVLALHRTGAAACDFAAQQPLVDQRTLVASLARTREQIAAPAVQAVSKCLRSDEVYSDLLVRDVLDDAEQAASELFTAAVSKGVAPAQAAHRAGLVYGVPLPELRNYRALAYDPRATPTALQAAADQVLLGYVEKMVSAEITEPVSKAVTPDRPDTPHWDARDSESGRFASAKTSVRERFSRTTLPDSILEQLRGADEALRQEREEQVAPPPSRTTRQPRQARQARQARVAQTAAPQSKERSRERTPQRAARTKDRERIQVDARARSMVLAKERSQKQLVPVPKAPIGTTPWGATYVPLGTPLAYVATGSDVATVMSAGDLSTGYGRVNGQAVIQHAGDADAVGSDESQKKIRTTLRELARINGHRPDDVAHAVMDAQVLKDPSRLAMAKRVIAANVLLDLGVEPGSSGYQDEIKDVMDEVVAVRQWSDDHEVDNSTVVLVHVGPEVSAVSAHVMVLNDAEGFVEGSRHAQYRINPEQQFEFTEPDMLFDTETGVFVHVHGLNGGGFAKAIVPDRPDTPRWDARDSESGRFASATAERSRDAVDIDALVRQAQEREASRETEQVPTRQTRQVRQARQARQTRQARTVQAARPVARERIRERERAPRLQQRVRAARTMMPAERQRIRQALAAATAAKTDAPRPTMPQLNETKQYAVLGLTDLAMLLGQHGMSAQEAWSAIADDDSVALDPTSKGGLLSLPPTYGDRAANAIRLSAEQEMEANDDSPEGALLFEEAQYFDPRDPASAGDLVDLITEQFEAKPWLVSVSLVPTEDASYFWVAGNASPVEDRVVIEFADEYDPDQPMNLQFVGRGRSSELEASPFEREMTEIAEGGFSVGIRYFRLTNAPYRRYLAQ